MFWTPWNDGADRTAVYLERLLTEYIRSEWVYCIISKNLLMCEAGFSKVALLKMVDPCKTFRESLNQFKKKMISYLKVVGSLFTRSNRPENHLGNYDVFNVGSFINADTMLILYAA